MKTSGERATLLRILDANANRAREAIRVLEEYARFVLEDATLSQRCKLMRHTLQQSVALLTEQAGNIPVMLFRDTPGDVGTALTTSSEVSRNSSVDVLQASANRLSEALRTLEEYGKQNSPAFAKQIEKLRYDSYTTSTHLIRRACPSASFREVKLYVLITEAQCSGDWYATAEAALRGGAQALQLREKELSDRELLDRAVRLRRLVDQYEAMLIINDRPDIAIAAHAHGVHVGQEDLSVREARRILSPEYLVGFSTHTLEQVQLALEDSPDYLAVGPMFESSTKPQDLIAGPEFLQTVRKMTSLPIVAIGGITQNNASLLQEADTLAVCSAIISSADATVATKQFLT